MNKLLQHLYSSGETRRYHNRPKLNQTTGQHMWGVATIIIALHPNPSANLLKAALLHDSPEKIYGDLLSPLKVDFPEAKELDEKCARKFWDDTKKDFGFSFPELTTDEKLWLDYADVFECCLFALSEEHEEIYIYSLTKSRVIAEELNRLGYDL